MNGPRAQPESLLAALQTLLEAIYEVDTRHRVTDFLVTERLHAEALAPDSFHAGAKETLLVADRDGEVALSLYVDDAVLGRLAEQDPFAALSRSNLADFALALEGVSHFVYLTWNARFDRSLTLLELEMQAEVDKFVAALFLLGSQRRGRVPASLHGWLFEECRFHGRLAGETLGRYLSANRYAGRYCRRLADRFLRSERRGSLVAELRRFYRFTQHRKIRHILHGARA